MIASSKLIYKEEGGMLNSQIVAIETHVVSSSLIILCLRSRESLYKNVFFIVFLSYFTNLKYVRV